MDAAEAAKAVDAAKIFLVWTLNLQYTEGHSC